MTLEKKLISQYLTHARRLTSKNSLSILSHVKVSISMGKLYLMSTNLKQYFYAGIPFIENEGFDIEETNTFPETLFLFQSLYEAVKACKGKYLEVTIQDGNLFFGQFNVPKGEVDISKYVDTPDMTMEAKGSITEYEQLKHMYSFISDDMTRYFMQGVCFYFDHGNIKFGATDGRKAARSQYSSGAYMSQMGDSEVKDKIVPDISKFLKLSLTCIDVYSRFIAFYNDVYRLETAIIDGQFPNLDRVYPDMKGYQELEFNTDELRNIVSDMRVNESMQGKAGKDKTVVILHSDKVTSKSSNVLATPYHFERKFHNNLYENEKIGMNILLMESILKPDRISRTYFCSTSPSTTALYLTDDTNHTEELYMPCKVD